MRRRFNIVEVMLPNVSGEVGGWATVDEWTGEIEDIDCQHFDFWCDQSDSPIVINQQQRSWACQLVRRTLEAETELTASDDTFYGSAIAFDVAQMQTMSASEQILAGYLENVRQSDSSEDRQPQELRVRRSG